MARGRDCLRFRNVVKFVLLHTAVRSTTCCSYTVTHNYCWSVTSYNVEAWSRIRQLATADLHEHAKVSQPDIESPSETKTLRAAPCSLTTVVRQFPLLGESRLVLEQIVGWNDLQKTTAQLFTPRQTKVSVFRWNDRMPHLKFRDGHLYPVENADLDQAQTKPLHCIRVIHTNGYPKKIITNV